MPGCSSKVSQGGQALARCGGPAGAGSPRREKAALGTRVGSPILPPPQGQLYSCDSPAKAPRHPFTPSVCWACKQTSQQLQARQSLAHRVRDSVSSGAAKPRQGQRPKLTCHSHSQQDHPDQCPDVLCTPKFPEDRVALLHGLPHTKVHQHTVLTNVVLHTCPPPRKRTLNPPVSS